MNWVTAKQPAVHCYPRPSGPDIMQLAKGASAPCRTPAVLETAMAGSGSETRKKTRSVLVRLTEAEYSRLTLQAAHENASRADLLRRSFNASQPSTQRKASSPVPHGFPEQDRLLLSDAARRIGHLAGLLKLAVLKSPKPDSFKGVRSFLGEHGSELQDLQRQIKTLLEHRS